MLDPRLMASPRQRRISGRRVMLLKGISLGVLGLGVVETARFPVVLRSRM